MPDLYLENNCIALPIIGQTMSWCVISEQGEGSLVYILTRLDLTNEDNMLLLVCSEAVLSYLVKLETSSDSSLCDQNVKLC